MRSTLTLLTLALCTLLAAPVQAEETATAAAGPEGVDMEALMGAYMEAATPGDEHAALAAWEGTYDCVTKMRMDPAGDWFEYGATETISPMLGGRFIHLHVESGPSEMMPEGFSGAGILGFNKADQRYEQTWADSMGTVMLFMTGTKNADGDIELAGSYTCPYFKVPMSQRWVMKETDNGFLMEMYGPDMTGAEFLMGTVTAVRQ